MINPYGLLLSLSALLSLILLKKRAKLYNIKDENLENIYLLTIIGAVIGARAYHVLDKWSYYQTRPEEIFYLWQGGLGVYGALIFGIGILFIYSKLAKLSFLNIV